MRARTASGAPCRPTVGADHAAESDGEVFEAREVLKALKVQKEYKVQRASRG
jgi:hypothetical protein